MKQFDGFNHEEMTMGDVLAMENFDLPSVNDVIEGEVVRVTNQEVTVDIHGATEGTIYLSELTLDKVDSAKEVMAKEGYDPVYGARPLKRYISNTLETIIAKKMIAGEIYSGCNIIIDGEDDNIKVEVK